MVEELSKEYIITARAKGLTERMVKYKHALKNALLPIITVTSIELGYMLGGAIIIEQVFSMPGLGRLFFIWHISARFPNHSGRCCFCGHLVFIYKFHCRYTLQRC